ncbi:hypothetical protein [Agromyces humi]|uniref:hypothetical protein n=1 Tax=Agromyces humi TaxID=1766800 RepID=UPI001356A1BB|nr:hypothetical protein [Agromyces humi]
MSAVTATNVEPATSEQDVPTVAGIVNASASATAAPTEDSWYDPDFDRGDAMLAARGIRNAVVLALGMWAAIIAAAALVLVAVNHPWLS